MVKDFIPLGNFSIEYLELYERPPQYYMKPKPIDANALFERDKNISGILEALNIEQTLIGHERTIWDNGAQTFVLLDPKKCRISDYCLLTEKNIYINEPLEILEDIENVDQYTLKQTITKEWLSNITMDFFSFYKLYVEEGSEFSKCKKNHLKRINLGIMRTTVKKIDEINFNLVQLYFSEKLNFLDSITIFVKQYSPEIHKWIEEIVGLRDSIEIDLNIQFPREVKVPDSDKISYEMRNVNKIRLECRHSMLILPYEGTNAQILLKNANVDWGTEDIIFSEDLKHILIPNFNSIKGRILVNEPTNHHLSSSDLVSEFTDDLSKFPNFLLIKSKDITLFDATELLHNMPTEEPGSPIKLSNYQKLIKTIDHNSHIFLKTSICKESYQMLKSLSTKSTLHLEIALPTALKPGENEEDSKEFRDIEKYISKVLEWLKSYRLRDVKVIKLVHLHMAL